MKIAMLQLNFTVGDFEGNAKKIVDSCLRAHELGAKLAVTSELALWGYPPKDMLEDPEYVAEHDNWYAWVVDEVRAIGIALIIGHSIPNFSVGKPLYNAATFVSPTGQSTYRKQLLPTYDVFDEKRYFEPGGTPITWPPIEFKDERLVIRICEDIWQDGTENPFGRNLYNNEAMRHTDYGKPTIMIVPNGSPYYWGKGVDRLRLVRSIARQYNCVVVYVNQVGGNDDLIFDGRSFAVAPDGRCLAATAPFKEDIAIFDTDSQGEVIYPFDHAYNIGDLYNALVLGVRDYFHKTGNNKAVIGLSGGIDSAVVACIARDALGANNVGGVSMPSEFSSQGSRDDAFQLATNLGTLFDTVGIEGAYNACGEMLKPVIGWREPGSVKGDVTEENIQARIRGNILMAIANRERGTLVLSTGNKSELSVGYCTLYGDMAGGYAVLKDVYKTNVYDLARYINRDKEIIPRSTIAKPPSAELSPGQKDEDTLPPYGTLDEILVLFVESNKGPNEIKKLTKSSSAVVDWVVSAVRRNEYKRQQSPPGPKVTTKSFGSGWRYPIAAKFSFSCKKR